MAFIKKKILIILRKLQAFFGLDVFYIAKSGFWITLSYFFGAIISLISAIAFANFLPKDVFGTYKFILSILGILTFFSFTGMGSAISRSVAQGLDYAFLKSIKFQLRWSFLFISAINLTALYYYANGNNVIAISLFILSVTIPFSKIFNNYGAYLDGKKNFKKSFVIDFISTTILTVILIIGILLTDNIAVLIAIYGCTNLLSSLIGYNYVLKKYNIKNIPETEYESVIKFGTNLSFLSAVGIVTQQIDKLIVFHYSGAMELAIYSIASAIPDRLKALSKSIAAMSLPKLSKKTKKEIDRIFWTRIIQSAGVGFLMSATYIVAAPILFKILMPQYMSAVLYSQLLSLTAVFLLPHFFIGYSMHAQKMTRSIYASNISTAVIKLFSYFIFGSIWGVSGIIGARIATYILTFCASIFIWKFSSEIGNINEDTQ